MQQSVVQTLSDRLFVRLLDDITAAPITLAGTHSVQILDPAGAEVVAATAVGLTTDSAHTAIYTREWDADTFPRSYDYHNNERDGYRNYYRAVWLLNTDTYQRVTYFEVIRRRFTSQLTDTDFTDRHPYLTAQLPSTETTFAAYRQRAWDRIAIAIEQKIERNPGDLYFPEAFSLAHEYATLSDFWLNNSFDGADVSEDKMKHKRAEEQFASAFDVAMSKVLIDTDDDGVVDDEVETRYLNNVTLRR